MLPKYHAILLVLLLFVLMLLFVVAFKEKGHPWFIDVQVKFGFNKFRQGIDTMGKIQQVSSAMVMYADDHGDLLPEPPVPGESFTPYPNSQKYTSLPRLPSPWPKHFKREVRRLKTILGPRYTVDMPTRDHWDNPLYFDISKDRKHFIVMSLGSDGLPDENLLYWFPASETFHDIACFDLVFLSSPEGAVH